jgi:para-nitrobenzyl esterase
MTRLMAGRRDFLIGSASSGLLLFTPALSWAQDAQPSAPVETTAGKVSGTRLDGITRFLGVPYGSDTGKRRFQPASTPEPWTGVRACTDYGLRAAQSFPRRQREGGDPNPEYTKFVRTLFGGSRGAPEAEEGEDCLVLNVWTPDAPQAPSSAISSWRRVHPGFRR